MKTISFGLVAMMLAVGSDFAMAQQQLTPVEERELSEVEQAVEDFGPLSGTLRDLQPDLRHPVGFESVYRVPGRDDLLMRISGGLYAVFPRSVYAETQFGQVPLVPYGTTFFIGEPVASALPPDAAPPAAPKEQILGDRYQARQPHLHAAAMPLDLRVDTWTPADGTTMGGEGAVETSGVFQGSAVQAMQTPRLPRRQGGAPVIRKDAPRTIATDEEYRSKRLGELVRMAGEAGE